MEKIVEKCSRCEGWKKVCAECSGPLTKIYYEWGQNWEQTCYGEFETIMFCTRCQPNLKFCDKSDKEKEGCLKKESKEFLAFYRHTNDSTSPFGEGEFDKTKDCPECATKCSNCHGCKKVCPKCLGLLMHVKYQWKPRSDAEGNWFGKEESILFCNRCHPKLEFCQKAEKEKEGRVKQEIIQFLAFYKYCDIWRSKTVKEEFDKTKKCPKCK